MSNLSAVHSPDRLKQYDLEFVTVRTQRIVYTQLADQTLKYTDDA